MNHKMCPLCKGIGKLPGKETECLVCSGSGIVLMDFEAIKKIPVSPKEPTRKRGLVETYGHLVKFLDNGKNQVFDRDY